MVKILSSTAWLCDIQCYKELCYKMTALKLYNNYQESPLYNAVLYYAVFGAHKNVLCYRWTVLLRDNFTKEL